MIPEISLDSAELEADAPRADTVQRAAALFRESGTLIVRGVLPPALVHSLQGAFMTKYQAYFSDTDTLDALPVGNKRKMITVTVEGVFNNPRIYANPFVFPIMQGILGERVILNGHGAVASLPGAATQHTHRDYTGLFLDEAIDSRIPTFAVTVVIPLVAIDETVGGTRVCPGSHNATEAACRSLEGFDPVMSLGDCLLMDYMLVHAGQANKSDTVRPILYNIYSRPWFRDDANYVKQKSLVVPEIEYQRIPQALKPLFSWSVSDTEDSVAIDPDANCPCGSGRPYRQCHGRLF